jgi:A/G-specific adenine glycosylase
VTVKAFQQSIFDYYRKNRRTFAWRLTRDPYAILVSEIMLQQTQTDRVIPKYENWLRHFPSFEALAKAPLQKVLKEWQGLGYNRRALALKRAAEQVVEKYDGKLPKDYEKILDLPGIGPYTVGAIMAFAFNRPFPIIETNIRTVFIHFLPKLQSVRREVSREFFPQEKRSVTPLEANYGIDDKEILMLVEKTLDHKNPREWYYALMDYGVMLKKTYGNLNKQSKHYTKQSTFKGSNRELRAKIVRLITEKPRTLKQLTLLIESDKQKINDTIIRLSKEGFITNRKSVYCITDE